MIIPGKKAHASAYMLRRHKTLCKRHSAIEAMIGHLKSEHRLGRKLSQGECDQTSVRLGRGYLFSIAKISLFFFFHAQFIYLFLALFLVLRPFQPQYKSSDPISLQIGIRMPGFLATLLLVIGVAMLSHSAYSTFQCTSKICDWKYQTPFHPSRSYFTYTRALRCELR